MRTYSSKRLGKQNPLFKPGRFQKYKNFWNPEFLVGVTYSPKDGRRISDRDKTVILSTYRYI